MTHFTGNAAPGARLNRTKAMIEQNRKHFGIARHIYGTLAAVALFAALVPLAATFAQTPPAPAPATAPAPAVTTPAAPATAPAATAPVVPAATPSVTAPAQAPAAITAATPDAMPTSGVAAAPPSAPAAPSINLILPARPVAVGHVPGRRHRRESGDGRACLRLGADLDDLARQGDRADGARGAACARRSRCSPKRARWREASRALQNGTQRRRRAGRAPPRPKCGCPPTRSIPTA